jgi:hypothetical protein
MSSPGIFEALRRRHKGSSQGPSESLRRIYKRAHKTSEADPSNPESSLQTQNPPELSGDDSEVPQSNQDAPSLSNSTAASTSLHSNSGTSGPSTATTFNSHSVPPSHDTAFAGFHVTQTSFLTQLDLAVRAAWATRDGCKYADVKVMLLSWESDDLGVSDEVSALESVFRDIYHFDVEWWKIPDKSPGRHATKKVIEFVEGGNDPDTLLILYYAGHAASNPHQGGLPSWVAK